MENHLIKIRKNRYGTLLIYSNSRVVEENGTIWIKILQNLQTSALKAVLFLEYSLSRIDKKK